ncbi:hypothetical protein BGZ79_007041 [Entomortierella chlamydospora]|nr:hypothetical protein BGZ79_007041 [Entomortierella chlamydospora]
MATPLDPFDTLCHKVFIANADTGFDQSPPIPTNEETALSLVSRAQVYEFPASYTIPASFTNTSLSTATAVTAPQDRRCYRIHLETIEDLTVQQSVYQILIEAIDPAALLELPFDRSLSGYSSKTRTESCESTLDTPVVLDMGQLSAPSEEEQGSTIVDQQPIENNNKTMLLVPTAEWLRMSGRVRFWREESHRIKSAKREVVLNGLLNERWKPLSSITVSSPPPTSGSLVAATIPPTSLPSPEPSNPSSTVSSLRSPISQEQSPGLTSRPSACKQAFQEHQLDTLAQFMTQFGEELSASSILKGLLNLIQRQLTEEKVLSWTFDRANLTEQKAEVTTAFLDLGARLGLELVEANIDWDANSTLNQATLNSTDSTATNVVVVTDGNKEKQSTDLTWTFGSKIDDRRLEYWIQNIQQSSLPVLKTDIPIDSTLPLSNPSLNQRQSQQDRKPNPVPAAILKRFLQDRHTIAAGSIQVLMTKVIPSEPSLNAPVTSVSEIPVVRDRSFVLVTSKYALSSTNTTSSSSGLFVHRVGKDVMSLARWASSCGGRLDWLWAWLFASFRKSRYRSSNINDEDSKRRSPRLNDDNV